VALPAASAAWPTGATGTRPGVSEDSSATVGAIMFGWAICVAHALRSATEIRPSLTAVER
jgi:hypothetical protein